MTCSVFQNLALCNKGNLRCRLCCTNRLRDSLFESSVIAGCHEQLVPYEVQDQELAFVQHGAEAARFSFNLV